MKIAIFSDLHLGHSFRDTNDSFENAKQAFKLALENNVDLIILAGDIFDKSIPSQDTWKQAFEIFSLAKTQKSNLSFKLINHKGEERQINASSLPILSISGTHEYRANLTNALSVLESAGMLYYLKNTWAVFENLAVFGFNGIPEKFALPVLEKLNLKPFPEKYNIFLFHQSLYEYLPFDNYFLRVSDLPPNFNLYIDGHLHKPQYIEKEKLLITGSTSYTQLKESETEKKKVFFLTLPEGKIESKEIPNQRDIYFFSIDISGKTKKEINELILQKIDFVSKKEHPKKPILKIQIKGKLNKGETPSFDIPEPENLYLVIDAKPDEQEFESNLEKIRELQSQKTSIKDYAIKLLESKLKETSFSDSLSPSLLFQLLENNPEEAEKYLLGNSKPLLK